MTQTPRILLLYAAAGAGHRRAAEAIADRLRARGAAAALYDTLRFTHPLFRAVYVGGGLGLITRLPRLYGMVYRLSDRPAIDRALRGPRYQAQQFSSRLLLEAIEDFAPDAIISTHFLPAELCAGWRRSDQLRVPVYTVITDFAPHHLWLHAGTSGYCVATEAAAQRLQRDGIDPARVQVTGIPIQHGFMQLPDRAAALDRLGLDPDRPLVVLMGGGLGVGGIELVARSLIEHPLEAQVAIITGCNRPLRRELRQLSSKWIVRGFVDNMPEWLAAADVAISKAGGLATAELMAAGVPTIIPAGGLTGHETRNARYMAARDAALLAESADDAIDQARCLLNDRAAQTRMRRAGWRAARPEAADEVADWVLRRSAVARSTAQFKEPARVASPSLSTR